MNSIVLERQAVYPLDFSSNEGSMASPAGSADGIEITARTASSPNVSFVDEDEFVGDMDPGFQKVVLEDLPPPTVHLIQTSSIIEMFEGVVQSVSYGHMDVILRAKRNLETPDHVMAIDLDFVQPQDRDLVSPGAVFYLTMFKETTGRTVRNVEEIRFRRQPDWNRTMFKKLDTLAAQLF